MRLTEEAKAVIAAGKWVEFCDPDGPLWVSYGGEDYYRCIRGERIEILSYKTTDDEIIRPERDRDTWATVPSDLFLQLWS